MMLPLTFSKLFSAGSRVSVGHQARNHTATTTTTTTTTALTTTTRTADIGTRKHLNAQ
jgi:hypothetical protein